MIGQLERQNAIYGAVVAIQGFMADRPLLYGYRESIFIALRAFFQLAQLKGLNWKHLQMATKF